MGGGFSREHIKHDFNVNFQTFYDTAVQVNVEISFSDYGLND